MALLRLPTLHGLHTNVVYMASSDFFTKSYISMLCMLHAVLTNMYIAALDIATHAHATIRASLYIVVACPLSV